jgi:hypothetical protein
MDETVEFVGTDATFKADVIVTDSNRPARATMGVPTTVPILVVGIVDPVATVSQQHHGAHHPSGAAV